MLLQKGANINELNSEGKTGLTLCITLNNEEAVNFLLSKHANPHIDDATGKVFLLLCFSIRLVL